MYARFGKRILDIILSLTLLCITFPLFVLGSVLVKLEGGGPVFFNQPRIGKDGKEFVMHKFRTMKMQTHDFKTGRKLRDKERVTHIGKFLRKTSIDELPQLINVLKGDMSFIGPRPLLVRYLPYYTEREMHRHDVRPGITGLAQVNGRSNLAWEKRFSYDLMYVKYISFETDYRIMLKTAEKVLKGSDTSVEARPEGFVSLDIERGAEEDNLWKH